MTRDCNMSIKLDKLGEKQLVSDYLDLRSSPLQTAADFFHQSGYTSSLSHACNVSMDGKLKSGTVVMKENLRKHCNANKGFIQLIEVVERLIKATCEKKRGGRCTELYWLVKLYSFDCPVCRYHYTYLKMTDLQSNQLANNIISEYTDDVQDNVQPPQVSEPGASNVDVDDPDADPLVTLTSEQADQIQTFREGVCVVAVETDEESSLPESLPSQVLYAPEDEYLEEEEEEEEDAVVPRNPSETPPPSSDETDNVNQEPPQMVVNVPQPNAPQAEPEREAIVPPNLETPPPEGVDNTQQFPSRPSSPGILHYILLFNHTNVYAPQIVFH